MTIKATLFTLACFALGACTSNSAAELAKAGSSEETAVSINAQNTTEGIAAENAWIAEHMAGCQKTGQALIQGQKGLYDKITVQCPNGEQEVFFEISNFFGKF